MLHRVFKKETPKKKTRSSPRAKDAILKTDHAVRTPSPLRKDITKALANEARLERDDSIKAAFEGAENKILPRRSARLSGLESRTESSVDATPIHFPAYSKTVDATPIPLRPGTNTAAKKSAKMTKTDEEFGALLERVTRSKFRVVKDKVEKE